MTIEWFKRTPELEAAPAALQEAKKAEEHLQKVYVGLYVGFAASLLNQAAGTIMAVEPARQLILSIKHGRKAKKLIGEQNLSKGELSSQ